MPNFSYVWLTPYYRYVSRWFKLILTGMFLGRMFIRPGSKHFFKS